MQLIRIHQGNSHGIKSLSAVTTSSLLRSVFGLYMPRVLVSGERGAGWNRRGRGRFYLQTLSMRVIIGGGQCYLYIQPTDKTHQFCVLCYI